MQRILYLDILKGFAIFFVVMLHVSGPCVTHEAVGSSYWWIGNVFDSICRFTVPVFVMVSGALFLNSEKPFHVWHSVNRLLLPLLLWSAIYATLVVGFRRGSFVEFMKLTFVTPTHNWFLYMLIGVYLCVPFLKKIVEDKRLENWFLFLWCVFGLFIPVVKSIPSLEIINITFLGRMCMSFSTGYVGFFILGHKLSNIKSVSNKVLLPLLLLSIVCIACATYVLSIEKCSLSEVFYDYLNPLVALSASSTFLLIKNACNGVNNLYLPPAYIIKMSKYSLGIYMLHMIVYIVLRKFALGYNVFNPIISIPIISVLIYAISYIIIFLIDKIPYLRKYLL